MFLRWISPTLLHYALDCASLTVRFYAIVFVEKKKIAANWLRCTQFEINFKWIFFIKYFVFYIEFYVKITKRVFTNTYICHSNKCIILALTRLEQNFFCVLQNSWNNSFLSSSIVFCIWITLLFEFFFIWYNVFICSLFVCFSTNRSDTFVLVLKYMQSTIVTIVSTKSCSIKYFIFNQSFPFKITIYSASQHWITVSIQSAEYFLISKEIKKNGQCHSLNKCGFYRN